MVFFETEHEQSTRLSGLREVNQFTKLFLLEVPCICFIGHEFNIETAM